MLSGMRVSLYTFDTSPRDHARLLVPEGKALPRSLTVKLPDGGERVVTRDEWTLQDTADTDERNQFDRAPEVSQPDVLAAFARDGYHLSAGGVRITEEDP